MSKKTDHDDDDGEEREQGARDFGVFLRNVNENRFVTECGVELRDLVRAMRLDAERNKKSKGKLTVELSLLYENGHMMITPNVKVTKPPRERGQTWMYTTSGDNLSLDMERQTTLPVAVRAVPNPETKQVEVTAAVAPKSV